MGKEEVQVPLGIQMDVVGDGDQREGLAGGLLGGGQHERPARIAVEGITKEKQKAAKLQLKQVAEMVTQWLKSAGRHPKWKGR